VPQAQTLDRNSNPYNVRAVERTLTLLNTLADGKPRTLVELSAAIDLHSSTTFRLLSTLVSRGYVQRNEDTGRYSLGLACLELSQAYLAANDVRRAALSELELLRDATTETVHLALLDKMEVVYLEKLPGLHAVGLMSSRVGGRSPGYCTGVGKVLLAYMEPEQVRAHFAENPMRRFTENTITSLEALEEELAAIRAQGYALDYGEHEHEVRCVAAPIRNLYGEVVAAVSVSGPANRMEPLAQQGRLITLALQSVRRISARLGHSGDSASRN
jgi:DNA-binding IclR family transcriptional regulator